MCRRSPSSRRARAFCNVGDLSGASRQAKNAARRSTSYNSAVLTSSAPTRIDLAGGTIDIWPLYLFHEGACTLNAAISLRAHVQVEALPSGGVELVSIDTGRRVCASSWSELDGSCDLPLL